VATELIRPQSSGLRHQSVIQQRVYETRVHDIDELRQRLHGLLHVWHRLEQLLIDDADEQCRTRLHACVRASGRHFEHTL